MWSVHAHPIIWADNDNIPQAANDNEPKGN